MLRGSICSDSHEGYARGEAGLQSKVAAIPLTRSKTQKGIPPMRSTFFTLLALLGFMAPVMVPATAHAQFAGANVAYEHEGTELQGYLSLPEHDTPASPVIVLTPAWKGLDVYYKQKADSLAKEGYVVFAADIYGKGIRPKTNEEAGKLSGAYKSNPELFRGRMTAAVDYMTRRRNIPNSQVVVIGFCFGGAGVLELARTGIDVAGVVSFHGNLGTKAPAQVGAVNTKVLVLHGSADPIVPQTEVKAFKEEMKAADVKDWQLVEYGNAVHSFTDTNAGTDTSTGVAYDPVVAKRAFAELHRFLAEVFAK